MAAAIGLIATPLRMHACGIDARQPAKEFVPDVETRMPRISRALRFRIFALSATAVAACAPVHAAGSPDTKPYDDKLMRLSEILGAVHYLRELCGAGEGQLWRERMRNLMQSEGSSALRRARLTRSFNKVIAATAAPTMHAPRLRKLRSAAFSPKAHRSPRRSSRQSLKLYEPFLPSPAVYCELLPRPLARRSRARPREGARLATSDKKSTLAVNLLRPQERTTSCVHSNSATAMTRAFEP